MGWVHSDMMTALLLCISFLFLSYVSGRKNIPCVAMSLLVFVLSSTLLEGRRRGREKERQSYTLVVECPWGKFVLFCPPLNVLNVCKGCIPVSVFGIMVMVFGVISGMSSGDRRRVSV